METFIQQCRPVVSRNSCGVLVSIDNHVCSCEAVGSTVTGGLVAMSLGTRLASDASETDVADT